MRLHTLYETASPVTIRYYRGEDDWEAGEQAERIAKVSGIRIASNKELTLVAERDGDVVGAVWSDFSRDDEASAHHGDDVYCYDFDVAVQPAARGQGLTTARVGPQLIDAALKDYRNRRAETGFPAYIKVWVVNPKLAQWLQDRYDFETESSEWTPNTPHLVYYGK